MRVTTSEIEINGQERDFSRKLQVLAACAIFYTMYILFFSSPATFLIEQSETNQFLENEGCSCTHKNVTYDFCYHLPKNWSIKGKRFNCNFSSQLEKLGLLSEAEVIDLSTEKMPTPMFVTAMSENHFMEGLSLIANVRRFWPRQKIIIYDLGLKTKTRKKLQEKCLVEVRRFPFETYPHYVQQLKQYRWKPLVIAMMLKEFGALWYMDTSIRWKKDRLDSVYGEITCRSRLSLLTASNNETCKKPAYMLHSPAGHSIFAATHPEMYKYIPTDIDAIKKKESMIHAAGFAFVVRTAEAIELLKWYALCALEDECMAPHGAKLRCNFKSDRYNRYAGCHRYDQSAINLLLTNSYGYNISNYISKLGNGATVVRSATPGLTEANFSCTEKVTRKEENLNYSTENDDLNLTSSPSTISVHLSSSESSNNGGT